MVVKFCKYFLNFLDIIIVNVVEKIHFMFKFLADFPDHSHVFYIKNLVIYLVIKSPYGLAVCVLVTQAEGRRFESHTKTEISQTFSAYGTESLEAEIR